MRLGLQLTQANLYCSPLYLETDDREKENRWGKILSLRSISVELRTNFKGLQVKLIRFFFLPTGSMDPENQSLRSKRRRDFLFESTRSDYILATTGPARNLLAWYSVQYTLCNDPRWHDSKIIPYGAYQ